MPAITMTALQGAGPVVAPPLCDIAMMRGSGDALALLNPHVRLQAYKCSSWKKWAFFVLIMGL